MKGKPELYLWGLKVGLQDTSPSTLFPALDRARDVFEPDITNYLTEPDIMLYVPGQLLVLVEAKFTSGNPIAKTSADDDSPGEKPKSRSGILQRYRADLLPDGALANSAAIDPFYSQLYRNVVFAIHMANQLRVRWAVVSLVCEGRFHQRRKEAEFLDPTRFIHTLLLKLSHDWFAFYSWERLYADHGAKSAGLSDLAEYMRHKSAYCAKAFAV